MKIKVRYLSKTFQLLLIFICINSCKKEKSKADLIVDESIEAHGGKNYEI